MAYRLQLRRDTAANWTSADPTLAQGEWGYETDTGKLKVGDGTTAWTSLAYRLTSGEINTASNVGVGGVGVYKQKTAADLEFKNINAGSSLITVTDDVANNEIDIDVDETQIDHTNIANIGTNSHAAIDSHIASTSNPHSVTKSQVGLSNVANTLNNFAASAAPTVTDDSGAGYSVGSVWIDTTADEAYVCLDASVGAAVWDNETSDGVTDHTLLTNIGTNTHAQIDTHIADSTIHFTLDPDLITGTEIRLDNDQFLRARNFADSADIDILKVGTDDEVIVTGTNWEIGTQYTSTYGGAPSVGAHFEPESGLFYFDLSTKDHANNSTGAGASLILGTGQKVGAGSTNDTGSLYVHTGTNEGSGSSGYLSVDTGDTQGAGDAGSMDIRTGATSGTGSSGYLSIQSGNATGASGNSGDVYLISGNSTNGNSGDVLLTVGSAGATQGNFKFLKTGVPSVSGQVWTSSGTAGEGYWANAPADTEYLSGPGVAVVWPDGSGTHADLAAAYADGTIDAVYLMPNETGGAAHIIDNSGGPLVISRTFSVIGIGAETAINLYGNTLGNNLFSVTGGASFTIINVALGVCAVGVAKTSSGTLTMRRCEADGIAGITTLATNSAGFCFIQNSISQFAAGPAVTFSGGTANAVENCNFIFTTGRNIELLGGTNNSVAGCTFFGGTHGLYLTGGANTSTSNRFTNVSTAAIYINGASGSFDSTADTATGSGTNHVSIDAANAMTYTFRSGSFNFSKISRPSGQVRLQQFVDQNASLYCSTLKAFTDSSNTAITTIADGSTSLGTSISGVGSKTLNLSPSSGSAISLGTITAGSGQTAALNVTGAGGLNNASIILSGASAISGTTTHSGNYNKNFGDIINTGAASGTITLAGNSCLNLGTILDGGTITFGSTTRGMLYSGLAQNSGVVTLAGTGAAIGGANGSGTSFIVGASGKFSAAIGSVTSTSATTNSIECTGQGSLTVATIEMPTFSPAVTTGTNFFKNNSGSGNFLGGYTSFVDLLGGAGGNTTIDHRATSSGVGTFTWVAMNGQVAPGFGSSSSTITVTNSGNGSAIIGQCYNGGIGSGVSSMVASQNGSIVFGRAVDGTLSGTGAACFIAAATSSGITISASNTGSSSMGAASGYAITSSGLGSRARGYANTAAIVASATNSNQTGPGTNAQADSSQFGIAGTGIRLLHTTSAPTTEYNGTIRQNASGYMILRSGGVNITLQPSAAYTPTNVTTDRSFDANATTLDELADIVGTLIADLKVTGLIS